MKKHLIIFFLIIVSAGTVMAQGFSPVPSMPRFPSFPGISAPSSDFGGEKIGEEKEAKKKSIIEFDVSGYMGGLNIGGWTGFVRFFRHHARHLSRVLCILRFSVLACRSKRKYPLRINSMPHTNPIR